MGSSIGNIIGSIVGKVIQNISPQFRAYIVEQVQAAEIKAKETQSPYDDILIAITKVIIGI